MGECWTFTNLQALKRRLTWWTNASHAWPYFQSHQRCSDSDSLSPTWRMECWPLCSSRPHRLREGEGVKDKNIFTTSSDEMILRLRWQKGYVGLADVVACAHGLHSLHHVGVGPVPPAGVFVTLIAHGHLNAGQRAAGQDRWHAGQAETGMKAKTKPEKWVWPERFTAWKPLNENHRSNVLYQPQRWQSQFSVIIKYYVKTLREKTHLAVILF